MSINERQTTISLQAAQGINADVAIGDSLEVVTESGGSNTFLLGTDHLGMDILSRIIFGARISLIVALVTLGVGGTVGVVLGLFDGWYGGFVDEFPMRLVDIKLSIPLILIALVLVITLGQSTAIIVAALAIFIWPRFARQVRGEVLQL